MIFTVNSYGGYQHSGEHKLLNPHETLEQVHSLEHKGVVGIVPNTEETQLGPFSDMDKERSKEGFVAEFTQGGVLVDPETGKAKVVAFTIDVSGQSESGEIWLSSHDVLRKSEEVWLDPGQGSSTEVEDGEEAPEGVASIAGIAMPAMGKLLVVQMVPELPQTAV